jgi:hypothetical protein
MKPILPYVIGVASGVVTFRLPCKRLICTTLLAALSCLQGPDALAVGASTSFQSVEAESGGLGGGATVQALTARPTSSLSSPTLEASGHAYVQLNAFGQSVTLTNNTGKSINALNLRYSIPDAPGGGGINATLNLYVNGTFRQAVNLTSKQSWCYQANPSDHGWNQSPSAGQPHIFYDESHFFISGAAVPPGGTIMFRKDSGNNASFYWLDVVDLEAPPAPLSQPSNSLSITSYGAVANNPSSDSESAIQNCINAAQTQGKSVWIPPGTFYLSNSTPSLSATGITIEGAGMWHSVIYANPTLPVTVNGNIIFPTSCTIRNLAFDSNSTGGGSGDGQPGGLNVKGNNWLVENVWIQHMGAGIWADGANGTVRDCRIGCTWADGININNGNGGAGNNTGNDLSVVNCFVRGSGDDGIAINSGSDPGTEQMASPSVTSCTVVAPWWANNIGIYGGNDVEVWNNLCTDSVGAYGISVGQFGSQGRPVESGLVADNVLVRCGSYGFYNQAGVPALNVGTTAAVSNVDVDGNVVNNSMFMALGLEYCGANVTVENNTVEAPGTTGVYAYSHATGTPLVRFNAVLDLSAGQSAYIDNSATFTPSLVGNTWHSTKKLVIGSTRWLRADANSKYVCAENGGNAPLIANRNNVGAWEQFVVVDAGGGKIALRAVANNRYVCADNGGSSPLIANRLNPGPWESFIEIDGGSGKIGLRAFVNNRYVCAENAGALPLIANRTAFGLWETFTVGP